MRSSAPGGVERNESRASFRDVLVTRGIRVQLYKPNKHQQSHANCISANRTVTYKCAPWLKEGIDWTRKEKVSGRRWGCGSMGYELSGDSSSSTHGPPRIGTAAVLAKRRRSQPAGKEHSRIKSKDNVLIYAFGGYSIDTESGRAHLFTGLSILIQLYSRKI